MMLNNLISNAIKYNRPEGEVTVRVDACPGGVSMEVRDTGIGMAPDEVSRLFGEFSRIKNQKTRGIPGSGLGLSIVKKLALLYDGDVSVSSQPDSGSQFTILLRTAAQDAVD
jgi:signal transduction histidine kinase